MTKSISFDVNLLPKDPFFSTTLGKVLRWALSIGRYIVIFTELVVIISFVTRFSLDRQVTDLNGSINHKKTIILSYGDLEEKVRQTQTILQEYDQIKQQVNITQIFPELTKILPSDTQLVELIIKPDKISFSGRIFSQNSLNLIINNMQLSQKFSNVSVDKIESSDEKEGPGGFDFVIRADTKVTEVKKTTSNQTEKVNILDRSQGMDNL